MRRVSSGQGSLEYLLLLGAGSLVALIVFLLLIFLGPYGGGLFEQNVVEYQKIDLCTAADNAACGLFLNWNDGLIAAPNGFFLESTTWRTLKVDGIKFTIFCADGICEGSDFLLGTGPAIVLRLPITSDGYPCDPADEDGGCWELPQLDMCVGGVGVCQMEWPFHDPPAFPLFLLEPGIPKEIVIVGVGNLNNKKLVSFQVAMKVSEQANDGSFVNSGWDDAAEKISWYSTSPLLFGSSFQCNNLELSSSSSYLDYGCVFPPNCSPVACPTVGPSPPSGSLEEACGVLGVDEGDFVCSVGSGYQPATCFGDASSNFTHSTGINTQGGLVSMDISAMKGALFLENFYPSMSVAVYDFDNLYESSCGDDGAVDPSCGIAICDAYADQLADLEFYLLNPSSAAVDPLSMCAAMSNSALPASLDLQVDPLADSLGNDGPRFSVIDLDSDPSPTAVDFLYSCTQYYDFSGTFVSSVLNTPSSPDVVYIGARYPIASPTHVLDTLSPFSSSGSFSMGAFYYSP